MDGILETLLDHKRAVAAGFALLGFLGVLLSNRKYVQFLVVLAGCLLLGITWILRLLHRGALGTP